MEKQKITSKQLTEELLDRLFADTKEIAISDVPEIMKLVYELVNIILKIISIIKK